MAGRGRREEGGDKSFVSVRPQGKGSQSVLRKGDLANKLFSLIAM